MAELAVACACDICGTETDVDECGSCGKPLCEKCEEIHGMGCWAGSAETDPGVPLIGDPLDVL